jgi:hypothetical protein
MIGKRQVLRLGEKHVHDQIGKYIGSFMDYYSTHKKNPKAQVPKVFLILFSGLSLHSCTSTEEAI